LVPTLVTQVKDVAGKLWYIATSVRK